MNVPVAVVHGYWCLVGLAGGMSVAGVADGSRVADGTSRCGCIGGLVYRLIAAEGL